MNKLRNRVVLLAVAIVSVFALAIGVAAQDITFGLGEEDFSAWSQANAMSAAAAGDLGYDFALEGVANVEGDTININLTGSGSITANGFSMSVGGDLSDGTEIIPAQLEVLSVGDAVFFDIGMGWVELTLEDIEETSALAGVDPGLLEDPTSAIPMETLGGLASLDPSQFIVISRNGADYTVDILLEDLINDPAVQEALAASPDTAEVAAVGPMALAGSSLTYTQTVGDSGMVETGVLAISGGSDDMGATVDLTFTVNLDYGGSEALEAPTDAIPFEEFFGMMLGGGM